MENRSTAGAHHLLALVAATTTSETNLEDDGIINCTGNKVPPIFTQSYEVAINWVGLMNGGQLQAKNVLTWAHSSTSFWENDLNMNSTQVNELFIKSQLQ